MKSGILSTALSTVSLETRIGEIMWWREKELEDKGCPSRIVIYPCLKCKYQIKVPKDYIDQFKPGGREYHLDGQSYLRCPQCGETIEIKQLSLPAAGRLVVFKPLAEGQIFLDRLGTYII